MDAIYLGVEAAKVDAQARVRVARDRANMPRRIAIDGVQKLMDEESINFPGLWWFGEG